MCRASLARGWEASAASGCGGCAHEPQGRRSVWYSVQPHSFAIYTAEGFRRALRHANRYHHLGHRVGLDSNWASGRFQSDSENVTTHVIRCVDHPDTDVPLCVNVRLCGDSNANLNSCLDCFIKYVIRTMIVCIPPHVRHIHAHRYGVHCLACQQDRLARQPRTSRRRQL